MGRLVKDEVNPFAKFRYVGIDAYYEVVPRAAAKHGIWWTSREVGTPKFLPAAKGNMVYQVTYEFCILFKGDDERYLNDIDVITIVHPVQGAQTAGAARSYAEKLFMRNLFKIPTGEEDADASEPYNSVGAGEVRAQEFPDQLGGGHDVTSTGPLTLNEGVGHHDTLQEPAVEEPVQEPPRSNEPVQVSKEDIEAFVEDMTSDIPVLKKSLLDEGVVFDKHAIDTIRTIFETFLPLCEDPKEARTFWQNNIAVLKKVERTSKQQHATILSMFKHRVAELSQEGGL